MPNVKGIPYLWNWCLVWPTINDRAFNPSCVWLYAGVISCDKKVFGGFHLYRFELAFINQFYSRMTSLFQQSFANDYFRNHFIISSKYFDVACYWKQEAYSGPISFEIVKWQLNWFIWDASSSSTALVTRAIVELTRLKCKWKGN